MIIKHQIIKNNILHLKNSQLFIDYLKSKSLFSTIEKIEKFIDSIDPLTIELSFNELEKYKNISIESEPSKYLFNIFYDINNSVINKNTYLPTLLGVYLYINTIDYI